VYSREAIAAKKTNTKRRDFAKCKISTLDFKQLRFTLFLIENRCFLVCAVAASLFEL
jgi:hypothetical protein